MALTGKAKTEAQRKRRAQKRAEVGRHQGVTVESGASGRQEAPDIGLPETQETEKPLPELTPRETRLAMLYAEGGKTLAACCREVGLNPESHGLKDRVRKGNIHTVVAHRMKELGLSIDAPLLKIREFYDAKKEVPNPAANSKEGQLVALVHGGVVTPTLELRDNDSQRWAAEQTLKLHGAYPSEKDKQAGQGDGPIVGLKIIVGSIQGDGASPANGVGVCAALKITAGPANGGNGHG